MLSLLRIQNLAIVEELEVEFSDGLTVLTGETGAGKSVVLKAIELLTGVRAASDLVRTGAANCTVEGLFNVDFSPAELESETDELRDVLSEEDILIRRVIDPNGRSKVYLNGRLSTAAALQILCAKLIDITGQHQQQSLLESSNHLALLDSFGVSEELRSKVRAAFSEYSAARRRLETFLKDQSGRDEYFRRVTFERDELAAAALEAGKRQRLEQNLKRLANVETLGGQLTNCIDLLENGEGNIDELLRRLSLSVSQMTALDPSLNEISQLIDSAAVQLGEARIGLAEYASTLEADPAELESLREQVAEIARLERKYSKDEAGLISYLGKIQQEVDEYESGALNESALRKVLEEKEAALKRLEALLTADRKKAATKLAKDVKTALQPLGMKHAEFLVSITAQPSTETGADAVEFLLSANPGEPPRLLSRVASGGELSRILLVLKTILNEKNQSRTQIFDEVDTGISGAVAQIVGEKLRQVSKHSQVILVTHSPQVAAFADHHYEISKSISETKTSTNIRALSSEERVQSLAAMLAGKKVSSHFEQSARELLALRK